RRGQCTGKALPAPSVCLIAIRTRAAERAWASVGSSVAGQEPPQVGELSFEFAADHRLGRVLFELFTNECDVAKEPAARTPVDVAARYRAKARPSTPGRLAVFDRVPAGRVQARRGPG